jgi:hypothetical protein
MALNDAAVLTAAVGYVFIADPGTARPTPAALSALDLDDLVAAPKAAAKGAKNGEVAEEDVAAATAAAVERTLPAGWTSVGHTSRGDLPEFGFDGGDTEVRGTWQNESLREIVTKPIADYLTLTLHQFDTESFELYFGKNASTTPGVFGVAGATPDPVEKALLVVIVDGDTKVGFYAPKSSVRRDDSISLSVDEFAGLPVRATFLKHNNANKFEWFAEGLFN